MRAPKESEQITAGNYMLENIEGQFILHYTGGSWESIEVTAEQIEKSKGYFYLWDAAERANQNK